MAKETESKTDIFSLFGVTKETYENSKNINPIFDFSKVDIVEGVVISETPILVTHKAKFKNEYHKIGDEIQTPTIAIKVLNAVKDGQDITSELTGVYSVWLSSKTLALGFLGLFDKHKTLKNLKFRVKVETANYKQYGENTAYRVMEL